MLKINKTLPKNKARQYNKSDNISTNATNVANTHYSIVYRIALATLICGIMPGLMGLSSYIIPQQVSAAGYDITQISTMQEMAPYICDNTEIGQNTTLRDTRDDSTYTVTKLADGKCWMTQNLRIVDKTITPEDSDVTEDFTIPASSAPWDDTNGAETNKVYYADDTENGAYYSWYTAIAGSATSNLTSGNAPSSICPKGWKLPKSTDYETLKNLGTIKVGDWDTATNTGYWIGSATESSDGAAFFPAAGLIYNNGYNDIGTHGRYWSSTTISATDAYRLGFEKEVSPYIRNFSKYAGDSIRCLAEGWPSQDVNVVAVRVAPVISIDAVSGMTTEVEPHKVTEGTISATVSANTTYDVLLSTNNTSLTNPENLEGPSIPTTSDTNPVQPNTNAWGILNNPILTNNTHTYSPITTTPTSFYNTTNYDETTQSTTHTFTIGVSVAPSLPAGEYSTTVTITAVNN